MAAPIPDPVRDFAAEKAAERAKKILGKSIEQDSRTGYFVISCSEDGDVVMVLLDRETMLHRLDIDYWGSRPIIELTQNQFIDLQSKTGLYIIKGELIVPKVKQVVTAWDLP